jgi:hypothetical protein
MQGVRKIKLKIFPFTIYHLKKSESKKIIIGAVLHHKMSPENLRKRF